MDFGQAINALKKGHKVAREGWNGKNMFIELQVPNKLSKMSLPYVYMKTVTGDLIPWLASQADMLAEDWVALDNEGDYIEEDESGPYDDDIDLG